MHRLFCFKIFQIIKIKSSNSIGLVFTKMFDINKVRLIISLIISEFGKKLII